jgi:hypothetical protein
MVRAPEGTVLEPEASTPKTQIRLVADLIRAAGVDDSGVTYRWFQSPFDSTNQIDGNFSSVSTKYGLLTTAQVSANNLGTIGQYNGAGITTTNVPDNTFGDYKALVVHHSAITDIGIFKVEVKDSDAETTYQQFFTVHDISDPFEVQLISSAGDKLQNGVGTTNVYPVVYYGDTKRTNNSDLTFTWYFYGNDGARGAFVDHTRTAQDGGRLITANSSTTFTYDGSAFSSLNMGDIVKATKGSLVEYFEVSSHTGNTVTVRTPTTNTWLNAAHFSGLASSEFLNGRLFVCVGSRTSTGQNNNDLGAAITIKGDDIDAKGVIICEANK